MGGFFIMKFEITKEELDVVENYKNEEYDSINQLLCDDVEILLLQKNKRKYTEDTIAQDFEKIRKIYEVMVKNFYNCLNEKEDWTFYKETNIVEIEKLRNNLNIAPFLILATEKENVQNQISDYEEKAVLLQIKGDTPIPHIQSEKDIILAPFTKIANLKEIKEEDTSWKIYELVLEEQKFEILDKKRKKELYEHILKNAKTVSEKIDVCQEFDKQTAVHYENIRKLEQLIARHNFTMEQENYEKDTTEEERQSDLDDITRINTELISLKETIAQIFNKRLENANFVAEWEDDVATYLKSELAEIKAKYGAQNSDNQEENKEEEQENIESEKEIVFVPTGDETVDSVKSESLENIAIVKTLLKNIKELISKQQNHARIAEAMDSNYKALNNAFEMKNFAEELDSLVKAISNKIDTLSSKEKEELDKISKVNLQVSILLNYLNNAKAAAGKRITRFDEMQIIEENELKKEIAETIKNIRCEAELKKLTDDLDIIEEKSRLSKFFGRFTGRNKLDQTMLDQIHVRQMAIKKTFKAKMPLAHNYSIHELIAEIEMFIRENEDDELVFDEVSSLRKIKDVLKKNFVIIDSRVMSIIDKKTGKNLPFASRKISKKELIEIDTYRFLNRYGYDKSYEGTEPEYQDTVASEIKRIVDYIKSSGVL